MSKEKKDTAARKYACNRKGTQKFVRKSGGSVKVSEPKKVKKDAS